MSSTTNFFSTLGQQLLGYLKTLVAYLPNVIGAILLLLLAWLIARLLRAVTVRLLRAVNRLADRLFAKGTMAELRLSDPVIRFLAGLIFVIVILFGIEAATRVLQVEAATRWMDQIIRYLPTLLAGVAIIIVGILASRIIRDVTTSALSAAGAMQAAQIGRFAQVVALIMAIVIGLDQIQIDVQLPISLIIVIVAAGLGGLSLAFGLGARGYAANLIAAHQVARRFQPGETVRVDEAQGVIAEITATLVVVGTAKGRATIPAALFLEKVVTVTERAPDPKPDMPASDIADGET